MKIINNTSNIFNKKAAICSMVFYIMSGLLYIICGQSIERILFILSVISALIGINILVINFKIRLDPISLVYVLFVASFYVDSIIYLSLRPAIYGTGMLLAYILGKYVMRYAYSDGFYRFISVICIIFVMIVLIYGSLKNGISLINNLGIFSNSNASGLCAELMFTILSIQCAYLISNNKSIGLLRLLLLLFAMFFVVVSSCRIAIVSMLIQIIALICIGFSKRSTTISHTYNTVLVIAIILLLLLVMRALGHDVFTIFYDSFFGKFRHLETYNNGDLSNGRSYIWRYIWNNTGLLGDGNATFTEIAEHNVYFGLMNRYGKINSFLFLIFVLLYFCKSVNYLKYANDNEWKYLPLMASIEFLCISMTENYLMTMQMILMYISFPLVDSDNKYLYE